MKIGFFEVEGWEKDIVSQKDWAKTNELVYLENRLDELTLTQQEDFDIVSIFVNSKISKAVLDFLPNLKLICTRSTGFDHIDLIECQRRQIKVAYVPGYGDNTVAEYAFGLMLNLTRKIYQAIDQIKEIESFSLKELRGVDLKGKKLGVVGTGRIGKEAIKIAKGFSMEVLAYDPFPDNNFAAQLQFQYLTFEELLKSSDIITLHCPYNKNTHHLINQDNIHLLKKGCYLVNTARGAIVETPAIVKAIKEGILAGYGTDVLEEETEVKNETDYLIKEFIDEQKLKVMLYNHVLMKMPNVLITPHNAFNTIEALQRILNTTLLNIEGFLNNSPINIVEN